MESVASLRSVGVCPGVPATVALGRPGPCSCPGAFAAERGCLPVIRHVPGRSSCYELTRALPVPLDGSMGSLPASPSAL